MHSKALILFLNSIEKVLVEQFYIGEEVFHVLGLFKCWSGLWSIKPRTDKCWAKPAWCILNRWIWVLIYIRLFFFNCFSVDDWVYLIKSFKFKQRNIDLYLLFTVLKKLGKVNEICVDILFDHSQWMFNWYPIVFRCLLYQIFYIFL